jgi:hypothetical protein
MSRVVLPRVGRQVRISHRQNRVFVSVVFCVFTLAGGIVLPLAAQAPKMALTAKPTIFEKNQGQMLAEYQFLARHNGIEAFYSSRGMDIFVPLRRPALPKCAEDQT